ncbi:hypothetical protein SPI_01560 [Niveomyces insectorum RCEF 264]|uniref:MARVEL domain-containing protein n=1 Tax=Niveomyces insectorum RCEF 264 TaxID=1081102 RepID=A0A167Z258_9HYPO|nr:hypothetical protein SPI_01560 [Niveomyces insectorum RCEF 264]
MDAPDRRPSPAVAGPATPPTATVSPVTAGSSSSSRQQQQQPRSQDQQDYVPPTAASAPRSPAYGSDDAGPSVRFAANTPSSPPIQSGAVPRAGFPFPEATAVEPMLGAAAGAGAGAAANAGGRGGGWKAFSERLSASDKGWQWKQGLRIILCITDLIGIGVVAGSMHDPFTYSDTNYADTNSFVLPFCLITFGLSFIWCLTVILVQAFRRPPRPVHPGVAVGLDLVLWLAFIVTLLVAIVAVIDVANFGSDPNNLGNPFYSYSGNDDGSYSLAPNGTWVYQESSPYDDGYYNDYKARMVEASTDPGAISSVAATVTGVAAAAAATAATTAATVATAAGSLTTPTAVAVTITPSPVIPTAKAEFVARSALFESISSQSGGFGGDEGDPFNDGGFDNTPTPVIQTQTTTSTYDGFDPYGPYDPYDPYGTTTTTTRGRTPTATPTRSCSRQFTSCAQQDLVVNEMWHDRNRRYPLDVVAAVMQGIGLVLHFVLFVLACIDTHLYNRRARVQTMTLDVLQDMRQRGYVMVPAAEAGTYVGAAGVAGIPLVPPPRVASPGNLPPQPPAWPAASRAAEKGVAGSSFARYG